MQRLVAMIYGLMSYAFFAVSFLYAVGFVGGFAVPKTINSGVIAPLSQALLNDFRLSKGKTSLGFINPLIYSTAAKGFNDITSGSNPGCGTAGSLTLIHPRDCYFNIYKIGFTAGKGWDPVSPFLGLGRPLAYLITGHRTRYSRLWEIANFGVDLEERARESAEITRGNECFE